MGIDKLPFIRAIGLKNNGLNEIHEKEVLDLMSQSKIRSLDLSCNNIGGKNFPSKIGKNLRDVSTHFVWIDLTQNDFTYDHNAISVILSGLKRQKELQYAGLTTQGPQSEHLARLIVPKK